MCNPVSTDCGVLCVEFALILIIAVGPNTFKIVKKGEVIYEHTQNSGKLGDKDITAETVFPIWSMSKPITTVAMMILYDQKGFELSDNVSKYLPEFESMMCKKDSVIQPCKNQIKIII